MLINWKLKSHKFTKFFSLSHIFFQFKILRETYEDVKRELEEERMKRLTTETTLTRDLEEADRSCHAHLRRAASIHELDSQHLKRVFREWIHSNNYKSI